MLQSLRNHWLFRPNRNWQGPHALVPVDICYAVFDVLAWSMLAVGVFTIFLIYGFSISTFWVLSATTFFLFVSAACRGLPFILRFAALVLFALTFIISGTMEAGVVATTALHVVVLLAALTVFFGRRTGLLGMGLIGVVFLMSAWGWTHGHLPLSHPERGGSIVDYRLPIVWMRVLPGVTILIVGILGAMSLVLRRLRTSLDESISALQLLEMEKAKVQQSRAELFVQQQLLRASEQKFRTLFESANDAILLMDHGEFVACNSKAEAVFGCGNAEIINQSPVRFSPPRQPDGRTSIEVAQEKIQAALAGRPQFFEWQHLRLDGTPFAAEVSLNQVQLEDRIMLQAIVRDVSERKRAADELARERRFFEGLFEGLPGNAWVTDERGRYLRCNRNLEQFYGVTTEAIKNGSFSILETVHPLDREKVAQVFKAGLTSGRGSVEYVAIRRDGVEVPRFATGLAFEFDGKRYGIGVSIDISERVEAERALRVAEARYRAMFDMSSIGMAQADPQTGKWMRVNPMLCAITGYSAEEMLQMRVSEVTHPEDRARDWTAFQRVVQGEAPSYNLEKRYVRKDGVIVWVNVNMSVVRDAAGQPIHTIATIEDITERKRASDELRASEAKLRAVFESSQDAIGIAKAGVHFFANPSYLKLFGYKNNEQILGCSIIDSIAPSHRPQMLLNVQRRARGEPVQSFYESRGLKADGTEFDAEFSISTYSLGGETYTLAAIRDITERKRTEAKIRESEEKFSAIFREAPALIAITDLNNGTYVDVNDHGLQVAGFTREEVIGHSAVELGWIAPEDRARLRERLQASGRIGEMEMTFHAKDGRSIHGWVNGTRVLIGGRPCLLTVTIDITSRKLAEHALHESEQRYRSLFEDAGDAILLIDGDRYVDCNGPALELFGASTREQFLSLRRQDLRLPTQADGRSAEISAQEFETAAWAGATQRFEWWYRRLDGTPVLTEVTLSSVTISGRRGLQAILRDVSARKRAEEELRKLSRVVDQSPSSIVITDRQGQIEYVNPAFCRLTGYTAEEARGENPRVLKSGLMPVEEYQKLWETINVGGTWAGEFHNRKKNGELYWERACVAPITDRAGGISHFVAIKEDISEMKRSEAELTQYREHLEEMVQRRTIELKLARDAADVANRAKSIFLAKMSHEIRTPMNAILGFTQLMKRDSSLSETQHERLQVIGNSSEHLLTLINDILDLSKIEAQQMTVQLRPFDLAALGRDLYAMFAAGAAVKGLQFALETAPNLPGRVLGDEGKLRQILVNLLGNALKFTNRGQIILRLRTESRQESGWRLLAEVEDTGPGIDPGEIGRLFQPFEQTELGRMSGTGTGLGLVISREFARKLGGDITVESAVGRGSLFRVEVQLQALSDDNGTALSAPLLPASRLMPDAQGCCVLVVDDLEINRRVLREVLAPAGYTIREAASGAEAIALFPECQPHLIVMDLRMPGMDGFEAIRRIRTLPNGRHVKILCQSASAFGEDIDQARTAGADEFIAKPFREEVLWAKIRALFELPFGPPLATRQVDEELVNAPHAALPIELNAALRQAVLELDLDRIMALIAQVKTLDPIYASKLSAQAARFDYDQLVSLLPQHHPGSSV